MRRLNNPSATLFGFVGENRTQTSYILTLASPKINEDDEVQLKIFLWCSPLGLTTAILVCAFRCDAELCDASMLHSSRHLHAPVWKPSSVCALPGASHRSS